MTRQMSPGMIKGVSVAHGSVPREGTTLRLFYDRLKSGHHVHNAPGGVFEQLRNFYGMEIVRGRLIGEWDGPYFVPIERMEGVTADLDDVPAPISPTARLMAMTLGASILVTGNIAYWRNQASALNCGGGNFRFKTRTQADGSIRIWRLA